MNKEFSETAKQLQKEFEAKKLPANDPAVKKELLKKYDNSRVLIIKAATGTGKGAVIAPLLMFHENKKIYVSEPRTANTDIANYLIKLYDAQGLISYKYRFNDVSTSRTLLTFITDGTIASYYMNNVKLDFRCLIIDEVHERNKNIDILLTFARRELAKNKDFKLVIMSATIIPKFYENYYKKFKTDVMEIKGQTFPIKHYWLTKVDDYLKQAVELVELLIPKKKGILVFLSSGTELKQACRKISKKVPCFEFSRTTPPNIIEELKRIGPKVIFCTNIAESGITIPGIEIVIESGRRYEVKFNAVIGIPEMELEWISKAEATQRAGRAGRVSPGECYHLYSEKDYEKFPDEKSPDIAISDVSDIMFSLFKTMKLDEVFEFLLELPTQPIKPQIEHAWRFLLDLKLVNEKGITPLGKEVKKIPLDPALAVVFLAAKKYNIARSASLILSMLSINDSLDKWFNLPPDKDQKRFLQKYNNPRGELFVYENMLDKFINVKDRKKWCKQNFIPINKIDGARKQFFKFIELMRDVDPIFLGGGHIDWDSFILSLLHGFSRNIAIKQNGKYKIFRGPESVNVEPSPFLKKMPDYFFYFSIMKIKGEIKLSGILPLETKHLTALKDINPDFYKELKKFV